MTQEKITELLSEVLEKSKGNKAVLKRLKEASVHAQMYELAAELRDIEVKSFPKSEEQKEAESLAVNVRTLFNMAGLTVPLDACWLVLKIIETYKKKKGNTDIKTVSEIVAKSKELFEES